MRPGASRSGGASRRRAGAPSGDRRTGSRRGTRGRPSRRRRPRRARPPPGRTRRGPPTRLRAGGRAAPASALRGRRPVAMRAGPRRRRAGSPPPVAYCGPTRALAFDLRSVLYRFRRWRHARGATTTPCSESARVRQAAFRSLAAEGSSVRDPQAIERFTGCAPCLDLAAYAQASSGAAGWGRGDSPTLFRRAVARQGRAARLTSPPRIRPGEPGAASATRR